MCNLMNSFNQREEMISSRDQQHHTIFISQCSGVCVCVCDLYKNKMLFVKIFKSAHVLKYNSDHLCILLCSDPVIVLFLEILIHE